jgi:hypothetical protein
MDELFSDWMDALPDEDLAPVSTIDDGEGGVIEVYADGSYCAKVDGQLV